MILRLQKYFFIIFIILFVCNAAAQTKKLRFEKITADDGLSSNHISHVFQDSRGFIWISTQDGINRYDGYTFKQFKHIPGDINSLSDYASNHIYEDPNGLFWISTREGLNTFDPLTEKFVHYKPDANDSSSLSTDKVVCSLMDKHGNLWVGTRNGLNLFNPESKNFTVFKNIPGDSTSLSYNYVTSILNDSKGNLWIGTQRGLNKYDYASGSFDVHYFNPDNPESIRGNLITCFFEDSKNNLWVGTTSGLNKLKSLKANIPEFLRYEHKPVDKNSLSSNNIRMIDEDSKGRLWVATLGGGLNVYNPDNEKFASYLYNENDKTSLSDNTIITLCIDKNDNVWIGTSEKGINKYSSTRERFELFQPIPFAKNEVAGNNITSVFIDDRNNLWIGTNGDGIKVYSKDSDYSEDNLLIELKEYEKNNIISSNNITSIIQDSESDFYIGTFGGGLNIYNAEAKKNKIFKYNREDTGSIGNDFIHFVYEDSKGNIWIGTGLAGLNKYDKKTGTFKKFRNNIKFPDDPRYLNSPEVTSICEDDSGYIWVGTTTGGVSRFDPESESFIHFMHEQGNSKSISSNRIVSLFSDSRNRMWVGTFGGGLNLYDKQNNSFVHYLEKDGLPENTVKAIAEDGSGNLWVTTSRGVSKFNPEKKIFKNFDESDGLQGREFNQGAIFYEKLNGKLYFGGTNGLNIYASEHNTERKEPPVIEITDFKLFNRSVLNNYLSLNENQQREIVLSHDENIFSIEFAALDFTSPQKNQYAYMLEGFDKEWIYSGRKREATYTNLNPGSYLFKVKGSNSDGFWNETGTTIKLIVEPPFWKTWWAYSIYFVIAALGFVLIRRYELNRLKLRNELKLQEFESKNLVEVDQIKSRFFANLSHEFRTPLTIILGYIEKLKNEMQNTTREKDFIVMKRNASRLLQLINQLLELSRIESGNVKLHTAEDDIVKFTKRITASFSSLAFQKNIDLRFNNKPLEDLQLSENLFIFFDKKKLETVFYNLLSNAVKFTPEGEVIDVSIIINDVNVEIKFSNTGIEIPPEEISKIFNRFYQFDDNGTRNFEGTGIGLSLAKEYVELHKGKIIAESLNSRTIFSVILKRGISHLNKEEIFNFENANDESEKNYVEDFISNPEIKDEIGEENKTIILIVEDNSDLREMIKEILQNDYGIIEAENGVKGLKLSEEIIPDLIISDIMMPEMDGYELSHRIKSNEKTNHIPVILLTAKAAIDDKLQGLETGADEYLIKPFDENELRVRIKNLIKIRRQMREKFQSQMLIKPAEVIVPSSQKTFIDKLTLVIEKNISNESFSVENLCEEIGMSRTQLHRKIKAVTNQSTTEFIRNFRLQRAAELLKKDAGNIAQISYEVGFSSQAYFTKMFQQLYRQTPLEYKRQHPE